MQRLFLLLLTLAFYTACQQTAPKETAQAKAVASVPVTKKEVLKNGVKVGDKAPAFNLKGIDGNTYSFDNILDANGEKPKGYIIVFTCNTCPVAKMNEERIIALSKTYSAKGYPVVAIQPNDPAVKPGDSYEAMQSYAKAKEFNFLYLFDEGQKVYPKYGATRTPEVYLVDKDFIVRYMGAIDNSVKDAESVSKKFLENAIQALEEGKEPSPTKTKAIGCSIKTI